MTDYETYMNDVGIGRAAVIRHLKAKYPKYAKNIQSMVCHPQSYGICLLPEAEQSLVEEFGQGKGLSAVRKKRKPCNRTKANRITYRMDDELKAKVDEQMSLLGFTKVQDFFDYVLKEFLK